MKTSGPRRITMREVAEEAGVSLNTVSLSLRESPRISADTRRRVRAAAKRLGYRPDPLLAAGMARLRGERPGRMEGSMLALIHVCPMQMLNELAGYRELLEGCRQRAEERGYRMESFRVDRSAASVGRVRRVLVARGCAGVVMLGPWDLEMQGMAEPLVASLAASSCGRWTRPAIHGAMNDHFEGVRLAMRRVRELGYRRPGLATSAAFNNQLGQRLSGAFLASCPPLVGEGSCPPLLIESSSVRAVIQEKKDWLRRWRPDVVLTTYKSLSPEAWRAAAPVGVEPGLVQVGLTEETPGWAGIDAHNREVGAAAVDQVIARFHRGERGVPSVQRCVLIEGAWVDGQTCPAKA